MAHRRLLDSDAKVCNRRKLRVKSPLEATSVRGLIMESASQHKRVAEPCCALVDEVDCHLGQHHVRTLR